MDQTETKLAAAVEQFVWEFYESRRDGRLVFHNLHLARRLSAKAAQIGAEAGLEAPQLSAAVAAAWLTPTGFLYQYRNPAAGSMDTARRFFAHYPVAEEIKDAVIRGIQLALEGGTPATETEKVCADAWNATLYSEQFEESSPMLRLEQELMGDVRTTRLEWGQRQLQNLLSVRFYTPFARMTCEPLVARHILRQKTQMEKWLRNNPGEHIGSDGDSDIFKELEPEGDTPMRGVQTFFRTNYRTHINLSAIADNKANIMISVNSILISVLITLISYRNIGETNPEILLPVIIFLVSGLASLTFAVLSARPKITSLNHEGKSKEEIRKNIVFFGNFVNLDLDQYEEAMDAMFRDDQLLYGNMTRDMYYLGRVLDKKYKYLTISYNIFMMGFIATVVAFLYTLFS